METPRNPFGTIVFAGFSALTFVVFLAKGLVPIYFAEAMLWAVVALIWHKKNPTSQSATMVVLLLAVVVAAGEGYSVGQRVGSDQSSPLLGFVPGKLSNPYGDIPGFVPIQAPPTTNPCDKGIPGGVTTESFTAEDIAGFELVGATVSQSIAGHNEFNVLFANSPTSNKCLTKVEFEIVLGPATKPHTIHLTTSGFSEGPGWGWHSGRGVEVDLPAHMDNPELISWKISRAWGYKVPGE